MSNHIGEVAIYHMSCSGTVERVTQLLPATLEMCSLSGYTVPTPRTLSYFTISNPGLTQYKYETFTELATVNDRCLANLNVK